MMTQTAGIHKNFTYYLNRIMSYGVFLVFTISTTFPLIWLAYSSFKTDAEFIRNPLALPQGLHWLNYIEAWIFGKLGLYAVNSVLYTLVGVSLVLIFAMMAAYAFSKMNFPKATALLTAVFGMGILISTHSILIPLYMLLRSMGILGSRGGMILVYIAVNLPLAIFIGTEFMKALPDSLIESAYIDGASNMRMFTSIILPMTKPVMITAGILTTLAIWNEFLLGFVFTAPSSRTLPVGIYSFSSVTNTEYGKQFAALMLGTAPIVLVYSLFNKRITKGVVAGAVKG